MGSSASSSVVISTSLSTESHAPATPQKTHDDDSESSIGIVFRMMLKLVRWVCLDGILVLTFGLWVFSLFLHQLHDDYLHPQLQLMKFGDEHRGDTDATYFYRVCAPDDFSAQTPQELRIQPHFTQQDSVDHMLTHGVSVYPNLLTNDTMTELREWIVHKNYIKETWGVIENTNRYSWGIDVNMHPKIQTYWQELASNDQLMRGLEAIVGPDPAVIEFTAITSAHGATDQYMHADVIASASATQYARSFVPSYSLFIPLQDTTYEMGSTHVCPGSHLCSDSDDVCEAHGSFAVSGRGPGSLWKAGDGALLNQQTYHKGMGYTQEGGIDRVLLIATFAPRPHFRNGVETRQIGEGGSYSLLWHQWGHTLSDYVHADTRMKEPQKTLRSLGLLKGHGWNYLTTASMRMSNGDIAMREDDMEELEENGGLFFVPKAWQDDVLKPLYAEDDELGDEKVLMEVEGSDISEYHAFALGVLRRTKQELAGYHRQGLVLYVMVVWVATMVQRLLGVGSASRRSKTGIVFGLVFRLAVLHGVVLLLAWLGWTIVEESYWAKSIRSRKQYRIPRGLIDPSQPTPASTIPNRLDILETHQFASHYLKSYARVIDYAHPGNRYWKRVVREHAHDYAALSPPLQGDLCETLVLEATTKRRFLKQDPERFWYESRELDELVEWCHRDMTAARTPMADGLWFTLQALRSETRFGKFRETGMQTTTIPEYLDLWEKRLLRSKHEDSIKNSWSPKPPKTVRVSSLIPSIRSPVQRGLDALTADDSIPLRIHTRPLQPAREEPFAGAWLEEGDRVRGLFRCEEGNEWFRGTITAAVPGAGGFDVLYDDGDVDKELELDCVQRLEEEAPRESAPRSRAEIEAQRKAEAERNRLEAAAKAKAELEAKRRAEAEAIEREAEEARAREATETLAEEEPTPNGAAGNAEAEAPRTVHNEAANRMELEKDEESNSMETKPMETEEKEPEEDAEDEDEDDTDDMELKYPIGTMVARRFDDGIIYQGEVVGYDFEDELYYIEYTDGDTDEMDEDDMEEFAFFENE